MKNVPGYPEWMIKIEKRWGDRSEDAKSGRSGRGCRVGRGYLKKLKRKVPRGYKKGSR